jgi:hypothetical protein
MKVAAKEGRRLRFIRLETAQVPYKKWKAYFQDQDGKEYVRYFGGKMADGTPYADYTTTGTDQQRTNYLSRHKHDLDTPLREAKIHDDELYLIAPGLLSYYILWGNDRDIKKNIREYKKSFLGGNFFGHHNNERQGAIQGEEGEN